MKLSRHTTGGCMRLGAVRGHESRRTRKLVAGAAHLDCGRRTERVLARRVIAELIFDDCFDCKRMAAIPQGAFAVCKVRSNEERGLLLSRIAENESAGKEGAYSSRPLQEGWELMPLKYNSKLMNSIWGLYNRYSVHNFKKNTDANGGVFAAVWGATRGNPSVAKASDVMTSSAAKTSSTLSTSHSL